MHLVSLCLSLSIAVATAASFPDCSLSVSTCCQVCNLSSVGRVFDSQNGVFASSDIATDNQTTGSTCPTCSLLNMIPGYMDRVCNGSADNSAKVCDVLQDSDDAQKRMISGEPLLGMFFEPGRCDSLGERSEAGDRYLFWGKLGWATNIDDKLCLGLSPLDGLQARFMCPVQTSGGLGVKASWLGQQSLTNGPTNGVTAQRSGQQHLTSSELCSFSGDALDEIISADNWKSQPNLPRWRCFDVANRNLTGDSAQIHRILMFSVGDIPCNPLGYTTTTTTIAAPISGSAAWRLPPAMFFSLGFLSLLLSPHRQ